MSQQQKKTQNPEEEEEKKKRTTKTPNPGGHDKSKTAGTEPEPAAPMPVAEIEGVVIPRFFENNRPMEEHVRMLKALEMRKDDILLMAYCKSGTHWMWEVASMLISGKAVYEKRTKIFAMMETAKIEDLNAEPSPRVLNSHFPFRLLPRQIKEKKVKVIHVYRNVKDIFVSLYFHFRQNPGGDSLNFDILEKMFMAEKTSAEVSPMPTGNFVLYMKEMYEYRKNNPDHPFFLISYEETKENPEKVIEQLAKFLGVKASPKLVRDIADVTSFAKMRSAEKNNQETHLPPAEIFRKGEVGDWKNYLTVARSERLDAHMTQLQSCDYNFRYTL